MIKKALRGSTSSDTLVTLVRAPCVNLIIRLGSTAPNIPKHSFEQWAVPDTVVTPVLCRNFDHLTLCSFPQRRGKRQLPQVRAAAGSCRGDGSSLPPASAPAAPVSKRLAREAGR